MFWFHKFSGWVIFFLICLYTCLNIYINKCQIKNVILIKETGNTMEKKIFQVGNSWVVSIPRVILSALRIKKIKKEVEN